MAAPMGNSKHNGETVCASARSCSTRATAGKAGVTTCGCHSVRGAACTLQPGVNKMISPVRYACVIARLTTSGGRRQRQRGGAAWLPLECSVGSHLRCSS